MNVLPSEPLYGRFSRRIRAMMIDAIIIMVMLAISLIITSAMESDRIGRILGIVFLAIWLLYEPLLVSMTGGTVGHTLSNLRVVDDRGSNIGFVKAVVRVLAKGMLGWASFITMATTRRHQALHDALTRSTVQVRDAARANPNNYRTERVLLPNNMMPSRTRRGVVTVAYIAGATAASLSLQFGLITGHVITMGCLNLGRCSAAENIWINVGAYGWLGLIVLCIVLGWRGRLPGARLRQDIDALS
jgi:uncharacterized RDD family membrane protein YckC